MNEHSIQCFEHPHIENIFLSFVSEVFVLHSWKFSISILAKCPLIFMIISSMSNAIYIFTNAFGIYNFITSILCFESITPVVMISSNAAVGLVSSSREMYSH